jgi:hypothetical protein
LPADPVARIALFAPARHSTLCEAVWGGLAPVLLERCAELAASDELAHETAAHDAFCEERLRVLIGRDDALGGLSDRVGRGGRAPVVLVGERGSGKSSMAGLAARLRTQYAPGGGVAVHRGDRPLVSGRAARRSRAPWPAPLGRPPRRSIAIFPTSSSPPNSPSAWGVSAARPVAVLLDALDQIAIDPARNLAWL